MKEHGILLEYRRKVSKFHQFSSKFYFLAVMSFPKLKREKLLSRTKRGFGSARRSKWQNVLLLSMRCFGQQKLYFSHKNFNHSSIETHFHSFPKPIWMQSSQNCRFKLRKYVWSWKFHPENFHDSSAFVSLCLFTGTGSKKNLFHSSLGALFFHVVVAVHTLFLSLSLSVSSTYTSFPTHSHGSKISRQFFHTLSGSQCFLIFHSTL